MKSVLVLGAALSISTLASADVVSFQFSLDGLQESPPNASPGIGQATVMLDTVTGNVNVTGTFEGLIGTTTAAHIHGLAAPGVNAGVILALTIDVGVTSGSFTGAGTLTAPQTLGMVDGLTYINVHTTFAPGGEIRGQVVPASSTCAALSLAGLAGMRRRRR